MGDERKCFAGDLGSDVLGKGIRYHAGRETVVERVSKAQHLLFTGVGNTVPARMTIVHFVGGGRLRTRDDLVVEVLP